ncbi:MAG: hypothetical protein MUC95_00065 [Spirochaetes bacterium]|nr:hypothetical protein [Spirochaetota bacterium]
MKRSIFICAVILFISIFAYHNLLLSGEIKKTEKNADVEKLKNEIVKLRELAYIKNFMVSSIEAITAEEMREYYADDIKTLLGMEIKFFYSFGKIHGYVVLRNSEDNFAIIDNATLKIILFSDLPGKSRTYHLPVNKDKFRNLVLYRGDRIIAFPVDAIDYGKQKIEPGTKIKIEAECSHLKAGTVVDVM